MLSRPGPTPIHSIGVPRNSSMNAMYFLQFSGKSSIVFADAMDCFQPGSVT